MRIFIDGMESGLDSSMPISAIHGVEIYRGAAQLPPEFGGADGMCGVIAIWTRRQYR